MRGHRPAPGGHRPTTAHRYRLLGALEVDGRKGPVAPPTPKVAALLALLLCRTREMVSVSAIADELWGASAPRSATQTVQTYVYHLRKLLRSQGAADEAPPLATYPAGYALRVDVDELDSTSFARLVRRGQRCLEAGRPADALLPLKAAEALWRGPALANVPPSPTVQACIAYLDDALMRARELRIQAKFLLGAYRETIGDLVVLARLQPRNEWVHARLIEALSRAGRRADALRAYDQFRRRLAELGIDPSPPLRRLHLDVLDARLPLEGLDGPVAGP